MSAKRDKANTNHAGVAVFATGTMSLGLAVGFELLRLADRIDGFLAKAFFPRGMDGAALSLDPAILWTGTAALAFALPAVILNIPGIWRRLVVWGGTLLLTAAWVPVLLLASRKPEIGVALIAVLWSGFCSMFYSMNHRLPAEVRPGGKRKTNDGTN